MRERYTGLLREALAWIENSAEKAPSLCTDIRAALAAQEPAQAVEPVSEADFEQVMQERDSYHQTADELAQVISDITGEDIGEHSSANCPWLNALSAGVNFPKQPTAPAKPLSDQQMLKKLIECRSSVKNDCNEYDRFILRKEPHCNDVDYQEQKRLHDLRDYIDSLDKPGDAPSKATPAA